MRRPKITTTNQIAKHQRFTLLELIDRLLDKGVMVKGEILLSVADIDLVYLNLGLLLSAVKTAEEAARRGDNGETRAIPWPTSPQMEFLDEPKLPGGSKAGALQPLSRDHSQRKSGHAETIATTFSSAIDYGLDQFLEPKATIDPKNVEKGLAKLVLTLVDLIRKLMEKQAIRRVDTGQLNASEIERMGNAFLLLDERMEQLKKTFGLEDEDLNLDLGPLGELL